MLTNYLSVDEVHKKSGRLPNPGKSYFSSSYWRRSCRRQQKIDENDITYTMNAMILNDMDFKY